MTTQPQAAVKVLALSDVMIDSIYNPQVRERFGEVDFVIGCGDLPYYYLEYVLNALDKPLYHVRGNHGPVMEYGEGEPRSGPRGGTDLHCRVIRHKGILLAGVEGSLRYRPGPFQYSQQKMWLHVWKLIPTLLFNRLSRGRYLNIFVTHAPPWGIHDDTDLPHQGIKAFLWLDKVFQPDYHFHGHVHAYRSDTPIESMLGRTRVINVYGFQRVAITE
jgi:Icc-related predicted phosphoesterase